MTQRQTHIPQITGMLRREGEELKADQTRRNRRLDEMGKEDENINLAIAAAFHARHMEREDLEKQNREHEQMLERVRNLRHPASPPAPEPTPEPAPAPQNPPAPEPTPTPEPAPTPTLEVPPVPEPTPSPPSRTAKAKKAFGVDKVQGWFTTKKPSTTS